MKTVNKLALAGLLAALGVAASGLYIPFGAAKCFPAQAMINVISGVILGPGYAVGAAFTTSLFRNILGTGSLLAFPGSMIGAFLCATLYKRYRRLSLAFLGEVVGTGILGALAAYPIVTLILSKQAALFAYVIPFIISSVAGSVASVFLVSVLIRLKVFNPLKYTTRS